MNTRAFYRGAAFVSLLLAAAAPAVAAQALRRQARQPNIVIILADDLAYGDVGAYGSRIAPTPHIDRLAREGVRFTNGYVTASIRSPARGVDDGTLSGALRTRLRGQLEAVGRANAERK